VEIARNYGGEPVKRKAIVQSQNIPDSYLENILVALKAQGIIDTRRGASGGYVLRRPPAAISFLDIVTALEGGAGPVECVTNTEICTRSSNCSTRRVWARVKAAQDEVLGSVSVADVLRDEEQGRGAAEFSI
jgi:Rrf2 family protein